MNTALISSPHGAQKPAVTSQSMSALATPSSSYNDLLELSVCLWVDKVSGKLDEHDVQLILEHGPRKIRELHNSIETTGVQTTATLHGSLSRLTQGERKAMITRAFDSRRTQYPGSPPRTIYMGGSSPLPEAGSSSVRECCMTPKKRKWQGNSSPSTCGSKSTTTSASRSSPDTTPSSHNTRHHQVHSSNKRLKAASVCNSTSGRKEYYCGICNKYRNHKPVQHMRNHLLETCPSLHDKYSDSIDHNDTIDCEDLLLGCGYCKGAGTTEKYYGEAFLGLSKLVQHVLERHCTQREPLVWDTSVAINNVLTSKVFGEDFEQLRQERYKHWASVPLSWRPGSNTEALLYTLEKIGGCSMDMDGNIAQLDGPSRSELAKVVDAACVPILDPSVASNQQDGTTTLGTYNPNLDTQPHITPLRSIYDDFVLGVEQTDPFVTERENAFVSASEAQPLTVRQPTETILAYDVSMDAMFSMDG
ncbi:hypothetical protein BKA66DRAFT_436775 [Pyrenochaeta sp. MPI-SDFR-AT-0127]|nr:hypothetical protein BKA66DRAFT_436775 [Pyrenochaeta sp. MPI-SDFR-AT-0127]